MPEKTIEQAARELHEAVLALREFISREYPSRREVERRFISRERSAQRWAIVVALVLASACLSFLTTVVTVSACFLGDPEHPGACNWLPGYEQAYDAERDHLVDFWKLRERVARLERED